MRTIRYNTFETNSSSTHSLLILTEDYTVSSTSSKRYPLEGNIVDIFKTIRDAR